MTQERYSQTPTHFHPSSKIGRRVKIHGRSDSDHAGNKDDRRSISGGQVFVNNAPVSFGSNTQKTVNFSVTEAEGAAGVMVAQDMLYVYQLLQFLGLEVELPMILEMDNASVIS